MLEVVCPFPPQPGLPGMTECCGLASQKSLVGSPGLREDPSPSPKSLAFPRPPAPRCHPAARGVLGSREDCQGHPTGLWGGNQQWPCWAVGPAHLCSHCPADPQPLMGTFQCLLWGPGTPPGSAVPLGQHHKRAKKGAKSTATGSCWMVVVATPGSALLHCRI